VQRVSIAGPSDEDAAVAAALRRIDGRPDVRPVDPDEAARGRLDFAQVGSWSESAVRKAANAGAQGSAALDALPLQSFMPDKAAQDETRPFYEQVRRFSCFADPLPRFCCAVADGPQRSLRCGFRRWRRAASWPPPAPPLCRRSASGAWGGCRTALT